MYLRRLELQGYKTFAGRTEFEFDSGITAIVGPNGSGKSNIADALRWVMGEQRYSTLRAKRSEDMIFGGSQGRSSLGMAEVSLTLDNSNGWLPIEYSEVRIQRRAFRSGENEYYLNGSRVRMRDIVELLAKGGVSSNTYTIIGQGAVDAALGMRPEGRREIFEEAAGIAIYQTKRDQSLTKLEDTRSNILRVNDIINEIAPRLKTLGKQAERAEAYQKVSRELEKALEIWHGYRWQRAQEQSKVVDLEARGRQEALSRQKRELEETSEKIDEARKRQAELRGKLARWHSESGVLHSRLEELQRELAVKRERQRLLIQQRDEIQQDVSPLVQSRKVRLDRVSELEVELKRLAKEREGHEAKAVEVRKEMAQVEDERRGLDEQLAKAQDRAFQLATDLAERRNRLAQLGERREELRRDSTEHEMEIESLRNELDRLAEEIGNLEAEREEIFGKLEQLSAEEAEKQATVQSSVERQRELRTTWEKSREALSRLETRYELLSKLRGDLTGYSRGVRTVLSHKEDLSGIVATVAEVIEVPPHLERAVEAALGNLLQAVVMETWQDAEVALRFLEESDGGQAAFLPLDVLEGSLPERVPEGEGVLGLASELVGVRKDLEDVVSTLLGRTLIVEDLSRARSLHQSHGSFHLVTLEGQHIAPSGFLRGGSVESGVGILAREREWRVLPEQIQAQSIDRVALEEEMEREEQMREHLLAETAKLREEQSRLGEVIRAKEEERASWRLRADRLSQEIEWRRIAQRRLQEETRSLEEKEQAGLREIEVAQQQERETAELMDSLQERLGSLDLLTLQGQLAELRTAIAVLERSREGQEAALEGHRASVKQLGSQIEAKESRIAELTDEAEELESTVIALTTQIEELADELERLSALIGPGEKELTKLEIGQRHLEREEAQGRRGLQDYEAAYHQSLLERQRSEDELRNLQERIEADLELVAVSADWPRQLPLDINARLRSLPIVTEIPQGLEAKIKELKRRLRGIGPVNLDAPAEYREVLERHSFLMGQVEDLEKASQSLRKVVAELDRLMEEKFLETFNRVAAEFEIYFTRLFNGGRGKLVLTEPEHPLQSGIEILAQPPGQRRGSITMLSGGQRALTGVALTFAILKVCNTPYCLLDEVDSRLDEVNIDRFRQELKELAGRTQVIIITHNRITLESADAIYGITLAGDNTSTVLSLKLDEVEATVS